MGSYQSNQTWQDIQSFLPLRNRLTEDIHLKEEYVYHNDIQIHCDVYQPAYFKGTLVLFHGISGNGRLMSFLAVPFYRLGYRVICPDLPLYGYTETVKSVTYQDWLDCAKEVIDHYKIENTFLFGISLGGVLVYQLGDLCKDINGVITTCLIDLNDETICSEILNGTMADRWLLSNSVPKLFQKKRMQIDSIIRLEGICNNEEILDKMKQDKHAAGSKVTLDFLRTLFHPNIPKPETYTVPILLLHPEKDQWIDFSYSQNFYQRIQAKKRMKLIEGAGHFPIEAIGLGQLQLEMLKFIKENSR